MKIYVNETDYSNLADDDKARLFLLIQDKELQSEMVKIRKALNINQNSVKQIYSQSDKKTLELTTKIHNHAVKIIKKSEYLNNRWSAAIFSYILQGKFQFLPSNYYVSSAENSIQINITKLVSKNDLTDWINKNWKLLKAQEKSSIYFKKKSKKKYKPTSHSLNEVIDIFKLRGEGLTYSKIAKLLENKYSNLWDEKGVQNAFYRVQSSIKLLFNEEKTYKKLLNKLQLD